jgi:LysM repeat protein
MRRTLKLAGRVVTIASLLVMLLAFGGSTTWAQGIAHVVKPGETLATIAQAHGTTVSAIVRANGLANADLIWVGQQLAIPSPGATANTPSRTAAAATASSRVYAVKLGDTLGSIARNFGVSTSAIVQANGITNPDLLYVGQRLVIPGGSVTGGAPAPAPRPSGTTTYTVKAGDTLGQIALKYGTTAASIARANGLTSPDLIRVGMRLVIPGSGGASPAPAPSGRASRLVVSISQQHCWLYQGNAVVGSWACSTGRRGWPTRPGSFRIQSKLPRAYGSTWNIMMPYWLGIYWAGSTENGIHGLPWNATSGSRTWDGLVGTRITYGCVMLNDAAAKLVWNMAYIGMPVIIRS